MSAALVWYRAVYEYIVFFFNDTATTEIYTLSLHDALPILRRRPTDAGGRDPPRPRGAARARAAADRRRRGARGGGRRGDRSEEHTSELQSRQYLVCRLLLEKKKILTQLLSFRRPF